MTGRKSIGAAVLAVIVALLCMLGLSACRMSEEDAACYEEVLALALDEVGDDDWVPTGRCCGWSGETVNEYDQYNFYIDKKDYDTYKHYWLEDVPKAQYAEGLNSSLWETGDRVQHCINIDRLHYTADIDYSGVKLKKDTDYYRVSVYNHTVYFRYIYLFEDSGNYASSCDFSLGEEGPFIQMLYHKEENEWILEKIDLEQP